MNWMTVAWPMVTATCLTLALIHLRIATGESRRAAHLFFTFSAIAVAAISVLEAGILQSQDLATCQKLLRWSSLPVVVMVASILGFVGSFFGTGRPVLAYASITLLTIAHLVNFFSNAPAVRGAAALRHAETFGNIKYTLPVITRGPWTYAEIAAVVLAIAFVADASWAVWKRGERQRALIVGGSIVFFFLVSRGHTMLVEEGIVHSPYFVSFAFLAVIFAMGHELSGEVFRATRLSRELQESERRMDLAAQSANLGFWTWHLAKDEIWVSETTRELFETAPTEKINFARFVASLHPDDREQVTQAITHAIDSGSEYEKSYRIHLPRGGERWIVARGKVELSPQGKPLRMRGVLMDVSAQKLAEAELLQLRQQLAHAGRVSMMGQLASALAHELNQPLGAILRNAEAAELFLQAPQPDLQELRAIIGDIRNDDQRASQVIDRLRSLLKRQDIDLLPLQIPTLLDEVLALSRADATARGIRLEMASSPELPAIRGDRVHLQQVLLNLIINAMDAFHGLEREEKVVKVTSSHNDPGGVEIRVADNASGLPEKRESAIFEPFFTTKAHGMGMGLPISRTIVEAHGGTLSASNGENGGAVFSICIPAAQGLE
ncbi:sensor histidine kinase [Verrucomicrobium spinosum]|uniref:sensor histidine kinase n=1 Tax=Verrucomicrobium spinosum TaxID=2736 RepID=UPI0001746826|nr:ATP-binding protein [Verrucomicrobium spinosum]